jgi:hypothetical protein
MATPAKKSPEQVRAEQERTEYSTWVAVAPIPFGNTLAFQPGHPVPVSHVEQYKYDEQGLVERVRGEDRQQAAAAVPGTSVTADQQ